MFFRRFWSISIVVTSCFTLLGVDQFDIPHVAAATWKTTVTVYNLGDTSETITLIHWNQDGVETGSTQHDVPVHGNIELLSSDFGYDGIARVESSEDASIRVKLSYLFLKDNSQSLCEFFLLKNEQAKKWFLPNPFQSHFDWFGIAFANHGDQAANLTLKAYKNGQEVGSTTKRIDAKTKSVGISSSLWPGLAYADITFVVIESDRDISVPISITGNNEQDRHLFFSASRIPNAGSVNMYLIPHIPGGNWKTTLRAYNPTGEQGVFRYYKIDAEGNESPFYDYYANSFQVAEINSDSQLIKNGMAWIKSYKPLVFTLSYQFASSESICEFILHSSSSSHWIVPNTINSWFDWFGLAVSNFNESPVQITLTAYKNGSKVGVEDMTVPPLRKRVDLSDQIWSQSQIHYNDVDLVVIDSDLPIPNPIAITGNTDQNRHVFFQGQNMSSSIPIPDTNFKAFLVANYDSNGDGEISYGEALVPTYMNTPGDSNPTGKLQNLEGLQFFSNLTSFNATDEELYSIPDISNLKKLETLSLSRNPLPMLPELSGLTALNQLDLIDTQVESLPRLPAPLKRVYATSAKIKHVDLSGLVNLEYFDVSFNPLENIMMTGLQKLKFLFLNNTSLTQLDLSPCSLLETLYAQECQLTTLNIQGCSHLKVLDAESNKLSSIQGFNTSRELAFVYLGNNQFTSLDISGLTQLTNFSCATNQLQSLDLSGKNKLKYLNVSGNKLTSLIVTGCTSLETFYCAGNLLEDIPDVTPFSGINNYQCYNNYFGPDDCPIIKAIEAMNLDTFYYENQANGVTLTCP